jgi:hypothetical protein
VERWERRKVGKEEGGAEGLEAEMDRSSFSFLVLDFSHLTALPKAGRESKRKRKRKEKNRVGGPARFFRLPDPDVGPASTGIKVEIPQPMQFTEYPS